MSSFYPYKLGTAGGVGNVVATGVVSVELLLSVVVVSSLIIVSVELLVSVVVVVSSELVLLSVVVLVVSLLGVSGVLLELVLSPPPHALNDILSIKANTKLRIYFIMCSSLLVAL